MSKEIKKKKIEYNVLLIDLINKRKKVYIYNEYKEK